MGIDIHKTDFEPAEYARFGARLEEQLALLRELLHRPDFGRGEASVGAELELYIVDAAGRPALKNQVLFDDAADPQLTVELNQYNLEYNLTPRLLAQAGLLATEQEIVDKLARLNHQAAGYDVQLLPIGILPTLTPEDFGADCVTDRARYRALIAQLIARRGSDFLIDINGAQPLRLAAADITLEGANTSFQVHMRVNAADYAARFNAAQLATPLALALSANSPGIFGHSLWDETRVPLFKQSIDTRQRDRYGWHEPPRVSFGQGWVRRGAFELFEETVRLYPPLLPACDDHAGVADPAGAAPTLAELRLHQSTVWLWNRPVYDDAAGGHLRIEMRALPAGPSAIDMVAGAALMLGLTQGLGEEIDGLISALPFHLAEYNFYRAAQHGLDASLVWPDPRRQGLRERPVTEIVAELLPTAETGLQALGVSSAERQRFLGVIDKRLAARRNGAQWQRLATRGHLNAGLDKPQALAQMLQRYRALSADNLPVAEWPL